MCIAICCEESLLSIEENKAIVSQFIESVFGGKNRDSAIDLLDADCSWWMIGSLPTSGLYEGKQAIIDSVMSADGGVIDPSSFFANVSTLIGEGDHVAAEWVGGFTTVTGMDYENRYNVMFELKAGKICAIREYNDTLYMKEKFFS